MPATSTKKRLSATVYYLLTGLVVSWPALFATGPLLPLWRQGITMTPLSLGAIHLLVLGCMLTVAFGVLYQIVPIAFQAPPVPRHVLWWHLPMHIGSVVILVAGFLTMHFEVVGIGGVLLILNGIAYFSVIVRCYFQARNKTAVHKQLIFPFASLWVALLIGVYQAFFPTHVGSPVVLSHVLIGGFAFWAGLVIVFSYKLVPMFAISHGYRSSLPRTAGLYFPGVLLLIAAAWLGRSVPGKSVLYVGSGLILLGLLSFAVDMVGIVRGRKRRRLVLPLVEALMATTCIVLGHVILIVAMLIGRAAWFYPAVYLFGIGGLIPLMMAYMQKIVPFLWFEYRFSKRPERKTAPLIDDMVPKRLSQLGMALYYLGVVTGLTGFAFGDSPIVPALNWGSAVSLTAGSVLLFFALRHILSIGGTRPAEDDTPSA
jgi:hypothetical protein